MGMLEFCAVRRIVLLALFVSAPGLARSSEPVELPPELELGGTAVVADIVDGDTVVLDDGTQARLVGIQAPKLPLGRRGFHPWPLAGDARAALAELTLGREVTLGFGGRKVDRHGRLLVHLFEPEGGWIQGDLLRRGMARVYTFADNRALVAAMLAEEAEARAARRGIWGQDFYAVRDAAHVGTRVDGLVDSFQLVEGRVLEVAVVKGRAYFNFGEDWRQDFTISIAPAYRRLFEKAGIDLKAVYEGRRIRVRGWLKSFNGPMVDVTHPEQIEVLDP